MTPTGAEIALTAGLLVLAAVIIVVGLRFVAWLDRRTAERDDR